VTSWWPADLCFPRKPTLGTRITLTLVQLVARGLGVAEISDSWWLSRQLVALPPVGGFTASWWLYRQLVAYGLGVFRARSTRWAAQIDSPAGGGAGGEPVGRPFDFIEESPAPW
jgi:hypothetical protein